MAASRPGAGGAAAMSYYPPSPLASPPRKRRDEGGLAGASPPSAGLGAVPSPARRRDDCGIAGTPPRRDICGFAGGSPPAADLGAVPSPARRHGACSPPPAPRALWRYEGGQREEGAATAEAPLAAVAEARQRPAWEVGASELLLKECLGTGATAEVHRALWHGTEVAVKRLRVCARAQFEKELHMLHELRHPNLVLFMGAVVASPPMIICEFCAGGTLFRLLHERPKLAFSWDKRRKVALDMAKGMLYLHRRSVIHRDLKSLNVLLAAEVCPSGEAPLAKIADFGLSRHMPAAPVAGEAPPPSGLGQLTQGLGTYLWMAPEVLAGHAYDQRADVYSYAVVLYELACRRLPFEGAGLQPISIALAISSGARPDLCHAQLGCPPALLALLRRAWAQVPSERPCFAQILQSLCVSDSSQSSGAPP